MGKNKSVKEKPGFRELIPTYSDNEIIMILKKRKDYQPEAVELTVKEAIKRGIIYSEQDLFSAEYNEPKSEYSLFPVPDNELYRNKLRRSIVRMLYFVGIVPFIKGLLIQNSGKWVEGSIISLFGLIWVLLVFFISKKKDKRIVWILIGLSLVSLLYITYLFTNSIQLKGLDVFIAFVLFLSLFYGLFILKKIL